MNLSFRDELASPDKFIITLELVPGPEARGLSIDNVKSIARDAHSDGRITAISITDSPKGNPTLSPDVLGREILDLGLDVIVHFACRDMNRSGIESRALQLSRLGLKNIMALTGDYVGKGFAGQGAPVFDLDSITLICLLNLLSKRIEAGGGEAEFIPGCAVSPFKKSEAECLIQYAKLYKKVLAGAKFIITQLGYDARKFDELLRVQKDMHINLPTLGSVYHLPLGFAKAMHAGKVPGAVITKKLLDRIMAEWTEKEAGRTAAVERSARLAAVLKGLGYKGIHLGGLHRSFQPVERILNRIAEIEDRWMEFIPDFDFPQENGFYLYKKDALTKLFSPDMAERASRTSLSDRIHFRIMQTVHNLFFQFDSPFAPLCIRFASLMDKSRIRKFSVMMIEDALKSLLFSCKKCGDCAIQHVGFLCPESQCPKFLRNGACGGSSNRMCEVYPERTCVWVRAYERLSSAEQTNQLVKECIPPKLQELNGSSSWLNFYLKRDHQTVLCELSKICSTLGCPAKNGKEKSYANLFKSL